MSKQVTATKGGEKKKAKEKPKVKEPEYKNAIEAFQKKEEKKIGTHDIVHFITELASKDSKFAEDIKNLKSAFKEAIGNEKAIIELTETAQEIRGRVAGYLKPVIETIKKNAGEGVSKYKMALCMQVILRGGESGADNKAKQISTTTMRRVLTSYEQKFGDPFERNKYPEQRTAGATATAGTGAKGQEPEEEEDTGPHDDILINNRKAIDDMLFNVRNLIQSGQFKALVVRVDPNKVFKKFIIVKSG